MTVGCAPGAIFISSLQPSDRLWDAVSLIANEYWGQFLLVKLTDEVCAINFCASAPTHTAAVLSVGVLGLIVRFD
jgi:hypothetical protein